MENTKTSIKNGFNYSGSKFRILPIIQQYLPNDCKTIVEPFAGTFEVSLNTVYNKKIYNDKNYYLFGIIKVLIELEPEYIINEIDEIIYYYGLSKDNKEGFLKFREEFNERYSKHLFSSDEDYKNMSFIKLLTLMYYSFNYYLTMDKNGRFINTSGYKRSWFNNSLRNKLERYIEALHCCDIDTYNLDFNDFYNKTKNIKDCFYFIDPPYLISDDIYSRTNNLKWSIDDEIKLYEMCDNIDKSNCKFMLVNQLQKGDKTNIYLRDFSKKYRVINTDVNFYNCNYQRKNKGNDKEIIVINY